MTHDAAWARIERLKDLVKGLEREAAVIRTGQDPLLYLERRVYLDALQKTVAGLEKARVILAVAKQRSRSKT